MRRIGFFISVISVFSQNELQPSVTSTIQRDFYMASKLPSQTQGQTPTLEQSLRQTPEQTPKPEQTPRQTPTPEQTPVQAETRLPCSGSITLTNNKCNESQGSPSCKFIKNNQQLFCNIALNYVPYFSAYSDDGCLLSGSITPSSSCSYLDYFQNNSITEITQICCKQECQQIDDIENIHIQCKKNASLYNDFLNSQTQLTGPQANTIINNLDDEEEINMGDVLTKISALASNTLTLNTPFVSANKKFNIYAIKLDEKLEKIIEHTNVKIKLPAFNIINASLSSIYWKNNPYKNITNA